MVNLKKVEILYYSKNAVFFILHFNKWLDVMVKKRTRPQSLSGWRLQLENRGAN